MGPIKPHKILSIGERPAGRLFKIDCVEPDPELVKDLEEILARAKAGDIRSFAYAYQFGSNYVGRGAHLGSGSASTLFHALAWIQHHLLTYED